MSRPTVGICAGLAPVSWGPWRDRPSALVPAALVEAVQRAGWMAVLLAPDPDRELLGMLDALVVPDDAPEPGELLGVAAELGLAVTVLTVPADGAIDDFARELAGLLAA